ADGHLLTHPETPFLAGVINSLLNIPDAKPDVPRWLNSYEQAVYEKAARRNLFRVSIRFIGTEATDNREVVCQLGMQAYNLLAAAYAGGPNGLIHAPIRNGPQLCAEFNSRQLTGPIVMTAEELTPLWHPPIQGLERLARSDNALFVAVGSVPNEV